MGNTYIGLIWWRKAAGEHSCWFNFAPRLLLLDEPVSALDPDNRERAIDLIAQLSDAGVAVLAVFHDLDAIARLATRIVVMSNGHLIDDGPVHSILPQLEPTDIQP